MKKITLKNYLFYFEGEKKSKFKGKKVFFHMDGPVAIFIFLKESPFTYPRTIPQIKMLNTANNTIFAS